MDASLVVHFQCAACLYIQNLRMTGHYYCTALTTGEQYVFLYLNIEMCGV